MYSFTSFLIIDLLHNEGKWCILSAKSGLAEMKFSLILSRIMTFEYYFFKNETLGNVFTWLIFQIQFFAVNFQVQSRFPAKVHLQRGLFLVSNQLKIPTDLAKSPCLAFYSLNPPFSECDLLYNFWS